MVRGWYGLGDRYSFANGLRRFLGGRFAKIGDEGVDHLLTFVGLLIDRGKLRLSYIMSI
jgi:hypothetical protein